MIKAGPTWRLSSPLDAWLFVAKYLTQSDFDNLAQAFKLVLNEINPIFELEPDKRIMAGWYKKSPTYSSWLREGLIQSTILISLYGKQLNFNLLMDGETWTDNLIDSLLKNEHIDFWKSLDNVLPLLAEASPKSILTAIENRLENNKNIIADLFVEEKGLIFKSTYVNGLLKALECIAWLPKYLSRASIILTNLCVIEKQHPLKSNPNPFNSLNGIFKTWNYQVHSNFEERIAVLKLIVQKDRQIGWDLLVSLLPKHSEISTGTHKMRWRIPDYEIKYTWNEFYKSQSEIVSILLSLNEYSEKCVAELIHCTLPLTPKERNSILTFYIANANRILQCEFLVWNGLRNILYNYHWHPDSKREYSKKELKLYAELFRKTEPNDEIQKRFWMFDTDCPHFPDEVIHFNKSSQHEVEDEIILRNRIESIEFICKEYGIKKIIKLSSEINYPGIVGDTLARINISENELLLLCECLQYDDKRFTLINSFIFRRSILHGHGPILDLFGKLKAIGFNNLQLARVLIPLNGDKNLWYFIDNENNELKSFYWNNLQPRFYNLSAEDKIIGINHLLEFNRPITAMNIAVRYEDEFDANTILSILEVGVTNNVESFDSILPYNVERLFKYLDGKSDVDRERRIRMEWNYLQFLSGNHGHQSPVLLHEEMSSNPEFFIEVLKCFYKSDMEELCEFELNGFTQDQLTLRAKNAYGLLESWVKIPGFPTNGEIDPNTLWDWINKVRDLAKKCGRLKPADIQIGQLLAQCPKINDEWPHPEVCYAIETINTDEIKRNFRIGIYNSRGITSRRPLDGGLLEKQMAEHYSTIGKRISNQFPIMAELMYDLAKSYSERALQEDMDAEREKLEY